MDGYQASLEMCAIENASVAHRRSQIIAVTALAGGAEKQRGLAE